MGRIHSTGRSGDGNTAPLGKFAPRKRTFLWSRDVVALNRQVAAEEAREFARRHSRPLEDHCDNPDEIGTVDGRVSQFLVPRLLRPKRRPVSTNDLLYRDEKRVSSEVICYLRACLHPFRMQLRDGTVRLAEVERWRHRVVKQLQQRGALNMHEDCVSLPWELKFNAEARGIDVPKVLTCKQRTFCPFCWARAVTLPIYNQLVGMLAVRQRKYDLIEIRQARVHLDDYFQRGGLPECFRIVRLLRQHNRRVLRDCPGVWMVQHVYPVRTPKCRWACNTTTLALMPRGGQRPDLRAIDRKWVRFHATRSRIALAKAIGRATEYPAALYFARICDAALLAEQRKGIRLMASYDVLYGQSAT